MWRRWGGRGPKLASPLRSAALEGRPARPPVIAQVLQHAAQVVDVYGDVGVGGPPKLLWPILSARSKAALAPAGSPRSGSTLPRSSTFLATSKLCSGARSSPPPSIRSAARRPPGARQIAEVSQQMPRSSTSAATSGLFGSEARLADPQRALEGRPAPARSPRSCSICPACRRAVVTLGRGGYASDRSRARSKAARRPPDRPGPAARRPGR